MLIERDGSDTPLSRFVFPRLNLCPNIALSAKANAVPSGGIDPLLPVCSSKRHRIFVPQPYPNAVAVK